MASTIASGTVTFRHPFRLEGVGETWPAGPYEIETEQEPIESEIFGSGYRLVAFIHRHDRRRGIQETVRVDPDALRRALETDAAGPAAGPAGGAG